MKWGNHDEKSIQLLTLIDLFVKTRHSKAKAVWPEKTGIMAQAHQVSG
jgi:hypothetical protein